MVLLRYNKKFKDLEKNEHPKLFKKTLFILKSLIENRNALKNSVKTGFLPLDLNNTLGRECQWLSLDITFYCCMNLYCYYSMENITS